MSFNKYLPLIWTLFSAFIFKSDKPYLFPQLRHFPSMPVSKENPVTVKGAELGRYLFYDPILSKEKNISCASCHNQKLAFSDSSNHQSHGAGYKTRNTLPLFNLAWYSAYFWDGRAFTLEEQISHPLKDPAEMNISMDEIVSRLNQNTFYKIRFKETFGIQKIDSVAIVKALGQFLRTLISNNSKFDKVLAGKAVLSREEFEGLELMNDMTKGDCLHCHTTDADVLGTTRGFSNNGLDNIQIADDYTDKGLGAITGKNRDSGKFKIPSLRNVGLTSPYMHDGRFRTLEEVLDFYSEGVNVCVNIDSKMTMAHQKGVKLSKKEKKNIIAFLHTLTDSVFISNPKYANPFKIK